MGDVQTVAFYTTVCTYTEGGIGFHDNMERHPKLGRHVTFHSRINLVLFLVQMCQLLASRNKLMKERKILCQEVEFLRQQWMSKAPTEPVTPVVETASNASAENDDDGYTNEEKERDAWHTLTWCDFHEDEPRFEANNQNAKLSKEFYFTLYQPSHVVDLILT